MKDFSCHYTPGFILCLADLQALLSDIAHGNHHWRYSLFQEMSHCEPNAVTITYSNPVYGSLPNELSFHFPLLSDQNGSGSLEDTYACLHPQLAIADREGLYFEGDEVKGDLWCDWEVFWLPIRAAILSISP